MEFAGLGGLVYRPSISIFIPTTVCMACSEWRGFAVSTLHECSTIFINILLLYHNLTSRRFKLSLTDCKFLFSPGRILYSKYRYRRIPENCYFQTLRIKTSYNIERASFIEYKIRPSDLNSLCYCLCLYSGFYNTAMDGPHKHQGNLS